MKNSTIYILFLISVTVTILNRYTALYINNSILHFIIVYIAAVTFVFIAGYMFGKLKNVKSKFITALIVAVLCFIHSFLTWGGDWKTQNILYQNIYNSNENIEFQMRGDRFSFGYKKRVVNRLSLIPGFDWTTDVDTTKIDKQKWKKVDKYVNEMGFTSK